MKECVEEKAKENVNVVCVKYLENYRCTTAYKDQYFIIKATLINQEDTLNILFANNIRGDILFMIKLCLLFW